MNHIKINLSFRKPLLCLPFSPTACLYAFFLQQHLMRLFGPRIVFLGGIFVFFLCMVLTATLSSVASLEVATAFSGIGTAALTTTPTMLVTLYFREKNVYMRDILSECENGSRPERGIGTEVAVLDMAFYLSQVLLSFLLGPLLQFFKSSIVYIVVSAVTSAVALYCASRVVFNSHDFNLVMENKF